MLSNDVLTQMENAHFGRLSVEEKKALELLLEKDDKLKEEANAYQDIWHGFEALKSRQQANLFKQWDAECQENDEDELIEWYVNGQLGQKVTDSIDARYDNEVEFAAKIDAQRSLMEGFSSLQSVEFREKMTSWEPVKEVAKSRTLLATWRRPLSIAAGVLLLITASVGWWNHQQFSNGSLVEKYSGIVITGNSMGANSESDAYLEAFTQAHKYLEDKDFEQAVTAFNQLKERPFPSSWKEGFIKSKNENIEWSLILSLLGNEQVDDSFMEKLDRIANTNGHDYQSNAKALQGDLSSFWRF